MNLKLVAILLFLAVALIGCTPSTPPTPPDPGTQPGTNPGTDPEPEPEPVFDFDLYRPNELGQIPIWMYHKIGEPESIWQRTPDNFRADLQRFYDLGYRLVSLTDVVTNNINIPAGTSPMVLTFDDGHPSHFSLIQDENGEIVVDPDCAVGIITEFAKTHPDMGTAATFFVCPPAPFSQGQKNYPWYTGEHLQYKLDKLQEWGMEIGNHTRSHLHLGKDVKSEEQLVKEMGALQEWLTEKAPGYKVNSLALPLGSKPKAEWRGHLYSGEYQGVEYSHDVVLLVGSNPTKPVNHVDYVPEFMPRIRASNFPDGGAQDFLDKALNSLESKRYISDGDPDIITFPEALLPDLNQDSLGGKELRTYTLDERDTGDGA